MTSKYWKPVSNKSHYNFNLSSANSEDTGQSIHETILKLTTVDDK
jgi:hypothetical protein